ncbi:hypothetical protein MNBD_IGNAVI01-1172 [hydrothermal vent metagenome]|uniref:Uncharacterized protein n=1 Tax=hydrothermal vent metagenome TaxID=652676 RepID=A0A3B1CAT6_9ZZZZ
MTRITDKDRIDSLIKHFWENGFLTLSRKHGTYLPSPSPIGDYEVDAVGKLNKKYVLGLTLEKEDIENPNILRKIKFLANQKNKFSLQKVTLFLGCPDELRSDLESLLLQLDENLRNNIKIVSTSLNND